MDFKWRIKTRRGRLDLGEAHHVWSRFGRYTRAQSWGLAGALAGALGVIAAQVAAPWPIKVIFDYVLSDKMGSSWIADALSAVSSTATSALVWVCAAVLLIASADALFSFVRDVLLARTGQRVVGKLRQDLFAHLQTLSPAELGRQHTGTLLMRLTGDIQMLRQMLVNAIVNSGENLLLILAMIGAMCWLNPILALLGVCTIPLSVWASYRISRQITKATKNQRERESQIASIAQDVLGAMSIVQAYNRQAIEQKRFSRQNRSSIRAGVKTTRLEAKLYRIVSLGSAASLCAILYVGVRSVLSGAMTAGDLLVFVSYLRAVNKPMRKIAKLAGQIAKATACGQRIAEVFALEPSIRDRVDARELQRVRGEIRFDEVEFSYDGQVPALAHVTMSIRPSERVALVGHTGAGKSTLAKLLLRFYDPQHGTISIDGVDLRAATLRSLRSQIGWVHQDTVLFGMTAGQNIALGRPDATPAEIRSVAERVEAAEFIARLPDGYNTVLGQGGCTLSGGQRQRIALARALLCRPAILLLDEPATGLDERTRRSVEQAWMSADNSATTIVICHDLHEMERFDRVFVLEHGRVVQVGTHHELCAAGGEYASLLRSERPDDRLSPYASRFELGGAEAESLEATPVRSNHGSAQVGPPFSEGASS
ncbi:MAG: ABC transporter ATP-binding protein [Phycisphaerae bacterium]